MKAGDNGSATGTGLYTSELVEAQGLADSGKMRCQLCHQVAALTAGVTVWRGNVIAFSICDTCLQSHHVVMRPTDKGIEIKGSRVRPYELVG